MPYVLAFNRAAIEDKIAAPRRLARPAGAGFPAFMRCVLALREEIGIPHTLQALGVPTDRFDELAAMAVLDPTAGGNPVPFDTAQAQRMYEDAWAGRGL